MEKFRLFEMFSCYKNENHRKINFSMNEENVLDNSDFNFTWIDHISMTSSETNDVFANIRTHGTHRIST